MSPRILLLEDEPDLLRALTLRFAAAGFRCTAARNGAEGLAKIQEDTPDVIVTDLIMPEMDGYELVRQLKANTRTASIPVIVLTAIPQHGLDARVKDLQMTHILHKPFEFRELLTMARELLTASPGGPSYD